MCNKRAPLTHLDSSGAIFADHLSVAQTANPRIFRQQHAKYFARIVLRHSTSRPPHYGGQREKENNSTSIGQSCRRTTRALHTIKQVTNTIQGRTCGKHDVEMVLVKNWVTKTKQNKRCVPRIRSRAGTSVELSSSSLRENIPQLTAIPTQRYTSTCTE